MMGTVQANMLKNKDRTTLNRASYKWIPSPRNMLRKKAKCLDKNAKQVQAREEEMIRWMQERDNRIRTEKYKSYSAGQGDEMPHYEQEYVDDPTYDGHIEMDAEIDDMDDDTFDDMDDLDDILARQVQAALEARGAQMEIPGPQDEVQMDTSGSPE